ncbi:MAG: glucose-6-phosphate dehydrogenase [Planctomycetia bacterium]|nr:glucose-6-phosphate dehydrogenase [Planctomycetia bacterium]
MLNILIVIGASGDLTWRKIVPALFRLKIRGKLPEPFALIGVARTVMTDQQWADRLRTEGGSALVPPGREEAWNEFTRSLFYCPGSATEDSTFQSVRSKMDQLEMDAGCPGQSNCVCYLAVSSRLYPEILARLGESGLTNETNGSRFCVVIEKPFGYDQASAAALNKLTHEVLPEERIFRIDHYLGKETVNNIFALRFGNTIFEPLWNRQYIDHVQITAAESVLVGHRGAFYETAGVLRDMFANHLLQLLAITTMEPPSNFDADRVRDEKVKVLRAVRRLSEEEVPENIVVGQYEGYHQERGVDPESCVPTFSAIRLFIDDWRWKDVPFYLRSGKGMSCRTTQILIVYKEPPHCIFNECGTPGAMEVNRLLLQLQPAEGIRLTFLTKVPGTEMELRESVLSYSFEEQGTNQPADAYERLLLDAFAGDASLFARCDELEAAWNIIDPFNVWLDKQAKAGHKPPVYPVGNWGPEESNRWLDRDKRHWLDSCPVIRH